MSLVIRVRACPFVVALGCADTSRCGSRVFGRRAGEEPLAEVVADPEAVKKKEEEQAAKEAARLERLLAKKFAC